MDVMWTNTSHFQNLIYVVIPILTLFYNFILSQPLILPFLSSVMCAKMVLIVLKRSTVYSKHFSGYFENKTSLVEDRGDKG